MMKILRYIIILLVPILVILIFYSDMRNSNVQSDALLHNNVVFEGVVSKVTASNNHAFGIIELNILESTVKNFYSTKSDKIYPYRIQGKKAELYCTISIDRKIGDSVKVESNTGTIYYNIGSSNEQGSLFIITDYYNKEFIKRKSCF